MTDNPVEADEAAFEKEVETLIEMASGWRQYTWPDCSDAHEIYDLVTELQTALSTLYNRRSLPPPPEQGGWRPDRVELARLIALAGLVRTDGADGREKPNERWDQNEWESRILECIPAETERRCYALADAILALQPPSSGRMEAD